VDGSVYQISVSNPDRLCRAVREASMDGKPVEAGAIPIVRDGRTHHVQIVIGRESARRAGSDRRRVAVEKSAD
jgi:hypothetical protein